MEWSLGGPLWELYPMTPPANQDHESDDIVFFPIGSYVKTMSADVSGLGWKAGSLE